MFLAPARRVGKRVDPWPSCGMGQPQPRVYDHRIRDQVVRTGNPDLFPELGIPRKTALSWIRRGAREVVTLEDEAWAPTYHVRIAKLERRVAMLSALLRLVLTLLRISGFELERARVPDSADKRRLLSAMARARRAMPLSAALRVLRLSSARYHAWVGADRACAVTSAQLHNVRHQSCASSSRMRDLSSRPLRSYLSTSAVSSSSRVRRLTFLLMPLPFIATGGR
jgi:hypothetical protein